MPKCDYSKGNNAARQWFAILTLSELQFWWLGSSAVWQTKYLKQEVFHISVPPRELLIPDLAADKTQKVLPFFFSSEDVISPPRALGHSASNVNSFELCAIAPILFIQHSTCSKHHEISATTTLLWGCKIYPLNIRLQMTRSWSKGTLCSRARNYLNLVILADHSYGNTGPRGGKGY